MTDDRARLTRPVASRRTARRRAGMERAAAAFLAIVVLAELALSPTLAVGPVADPGPGEGASPVASVPGAGSTAAGAAPADPTTDPIRAAAARRRAARTPVPDQPVDPGPSIIALDAGSPRARPHRVHPGRPGHRPVHAKGRRQLVGRRRSSAAPAGRGGVGPGDGRLRPGIGLGTRVAGAGGSRAERGLDRPRRGPAPIERPASGRRAGRLRRPGGQSGQPGPARPGRGLRAGRDAISAARSSASCPTGSCPMDRPG